MIQTVIQHDTAQRDAQSMHVGEMGQSEAPRLMDLTENNFTLLAVQRTPSARIAKAPTIAQVLTLDVPRDAVPEIAEPSGNFMHLSLSESLNDLQMSLVAGNARRFGLNPHQVLTPMRTRAHVVEFLSRIISHGTPEPTE